MCFTHKYISEVKTYYYEWLLMKAKIVIFLYMS